MNFISIDFETANDNLLSACALGVVEFENSTMRSENHLLINPPYFQRRLKEENYNIHKIPYDLYSKSSSFKAVWSNLTSDMENIIKPGTVFICFNAIFDVSVLTNLLNKYNLSRDFLFYDPMEVAKNLWPNRKSYSLKNISNDLGIELDHHNPVSDANAAGILSLKQLEETGSSSFDELLDNCGLQMIKTDTKNKFFINHYGNKVEVARNFQDIRKK